VEQSDLPALERLQSVEASYRQAELARRTAALDEADGLTASLAHGDFEVALERSLGRFGLEVEAADAGGALDVVPAEGDNDVYRRNPRVKGPMNGFGYSWLDDHLEKARVPRPALLAREPSWEGPSFGYEALNLVDGVRTVEQIRDLLAATVGPAPVEEVAQYLATLERLGVVEKR
jgi:hypothetical protein